MSEFMNDVKSALFDGINPEDRAAVLGCIGYHVGMYKKGRIELAECLCVDRSALTRELVKMK